MLSEFISVAASIFTIVASGIAIYIFFFKRNSLKAVFNIFLSYAYQLTLNELTRKMDDINKYTAEDQNQKKEIMNILNDIEGQLKGNKLLRENCKEILSKISFYTSNSVRLTETMKRSLISELRENLRTLDLENYNKLIGS